MLKEIGIECLSGEDKGFYSTCLRAFELKEYQYVVEVCRAMIARNEICLEVNKLHLRGAREIYNRLSFFKRVVGRVIGYLFLSFGYISAFLKRSEKAWQWVTFSLQKYPLNSWVLSWIFKIGMKNQLKNVAVWSLEEWEKVQPKNLEIKRKMGQIYLEMGLFDKALKIGESILEKMPFDIEGLQLVQNAAVSIGLTALNEVKVKL